VKSSRLLPWVGWNSADVSFVLLEEDDLHRARAQRVVKTSDPFVEVTKLKWERLASAGNWASAAKLGKYCAEKRSSLSYGWENWAWSLHRLGKTRAAYKLLAPILKQLTLPGPPSGRAAFCLACFCGAMDRVKEGTRWLRLAYTLAEDKDAFRLHALREPDLRSIWPGIPELSADAVSLLE
jgi:hypothetical protein